jgi:hypothetical protein
VQASIGRHVQAFEQSSFEPPENKDEPHLSRLQRVRLGAVERLWRGSEWRIHLPRRRRVLDLALWQGYQLEFKLAGGSKPASFQTERFSGAPINFTKADAAFGDALLVVTAAP